MQRHRYPGSGIARHLSVGEFCNFRNDVFRYSRSAVSGLSHMPRSSAQRSLDFDGPGSAKQPGGVDSGVIYHAITEQSSGPLADGRGAP